MFALANEYFLKFSINIFFREDPSPSLIHWLWPRIKFLLHFYGGLIIVPTTHKRAQKFRNCFFLKIQNFVPNLEDGGRR